MSNRFLQGLLAEVRKNFYETEATLAALEDLEQSLEESLANFTGLLVEISAKEKLLFWKLIEESFAYYTGSAPQSSSTEELSMPAITWYQEFLSNMNALKGRCCEGEILVYQHELKKLFAAAD